MDFIVFITKIHTNISIKALYDYYFNFAVAVAFFPAFNFEFSSCFPLHIYYVIQHSQWK